MFLEDVPIRVLFPVSLIGLKGSTLANAGNVESKQIVDFLYFLEYYWAMEIAVPLKKFRNDLDYYLQEINRGSDIRITKYSKPFASVTSLDKNMGQQSTKKQIEDMLQYLDQHDFADYFPKGKSTKQLLESARTEQFKR